MSIILHPLVQPLETFEQQGTDCLEEEEVATLLPLFIEAVSGQVGKISHMVLAEFTYSDKDMHGLKVSSAAAPSTR